MGATSRRLLSPSTSLPPLRNVSALEAAQIGHALTVLHEFFCPLPTSSDFQKHPKGFFAAAAAAADSGYASEADVDEASRAEAAPDHYERVTAIRWLTGFIGRAHELSLAESVSEAFVDQACSILAHLTKEDKEEGADEPEDLGMTRRFSFPYKDDQLCNIEVDLYDIPMQTGEDHTDVGLQTWGASIALSTRIARHPEAFGLSQTRLTSSSRIVELGAGTGLVSLFLSGLMPHVSEAQPTIIATDYHPTVLSNLAANIKSHMAKPAPTATVLSCHLDWSCPSRKAPLHVPADIVIAADATYAPEHAAWLRDCAGSLLADDGIFWLMVSVRQNGKFAGISDTVEAAFEEVEKCTRADGKRLTISSMQQIEKRDNVGRADETGYKLFEIVWR